MTEPRDPPRWVTDPELSAGLRNALASHAHAEPGAEIRARVLSRVEAELRLPLMAATPKRLGAWLAGGLLIAAGFATWFVRVPRRPPTHVVAAPAARVDTAPVSSVAPPQPSAAEHSDASPQPAEALRAPANTSVNPANARKHASAHAAVPSDPRAELTLLVRARSLVSASPARALELVAEHATRYPHSMFAEEREVLAIAAERRLGRTALAAEHALRFKRAHPNSIHLSEVEAAPNDP